MMCYWLQKVRIYEEMLKKDNQNILFKSKIFLSRYKFVNSIPCCGNWITAPPYKKLIKPFIL